MKESDKAVLLIAKILDVLAGHHLPDCGGDFTENYYYCEKCKFYGLCRKMTKVEDLNSELQTLLVFFGEE